MSAGEQQAFLRYVCANLKKADIPYMITGSIAGAHYGESRATNDIDIVIEATEKQINRFITMFGDDIYVSKEAAQEALRNCSMFNLIQMTTGVKVDLIFRKIREFSRTEFLRRRNTNILGADNVAASPEDVILSKLEWAKIGNSDRQIRDAAGIARVQGKKLDLQYLREWAQKLEVDDLLEQILLSLDKNLDI